MLFSLPWAFPIFGQVETIEYAGIRGLLGAMLCSLALSGLLYLWGRNQQNSILRKEALAVVGLGWILRSSGGVTVRIVWSNAS